MVGTGTAERLRTARKMALGAIRDARSSQTEKELVQRITETSPQAKARATATKQRPSRLQMYCPMEKEKLRKKLESLQVVQSNCSPRSCPAKTQDTDYEIS